MLTIITGEHGQDTLDYAFEFEKPIVLCPENNISEIEQREWVQNYVDNNSVVITFSQIILTEFRLEVLYERRKDVEIFVLGADKSISRWLIQEDGVLSGTGTYPYGEMMKQTGALLRGQKRFRK